MIFTFFCLFFNILVYGRNRISLLDMLSILRFLVVQFYAFQHQYARKKNFPLTKKKRFHSIQRLWLLFTPSAFLSDTGGQKKNTSFSQGNRQHIFQPLGSVLSNPGNLTIKSHFYTKGWARHVPSKRTLEKTKGMWSCCANVSGWKTFTDVLYSQWHI